MNMLLEWNDLLIFLQIPRFEEQLFLEKALLGKNLIQGKNSN